MLLRPLDFLQKSDFIKKTYKGTVVDNVDPLRLGRVKMDITGLFDTVVAGGDTTLLPWIYPRSSADLGGRGDGSSFSSPDIGSELVVEFPYGEDVYAGFYTGYWQSATTHQGTFDEDYPSSYGSRDSQGTGWKVNRAKQLVEYNHSSGARVQIQKDGTVEIRGGAGVILTSEDGKSSISLDNVTGEVTVTSKGPITLEGPETDLNSDLLNINVSQVVEEISGSQVTSILSGRETMIGGSDSEGVASNKAISIGGKKEELVASTSHEIIGEGYEMEAVTGDIRHVSDLGAYKAEGSGLAKLKLELGKVGLGTPTIELLDLIDQILTILNLPGLAGPATVWLPGQFAAIQTNLGLIKGGV